MQLNVSFSTPPDRITAPFTVSLDRSTAAEFRAACLDNGRSMSRVMEAMMRAFCAANRGAGAAVQAAGGDNK